MQHAEHSTASLIVAIERPKVRKCQMAASRAHRPLVSHFRDGEASGLQTLRTPDK
jgi:hypothetical protein